MITNVSATGDNVMWVEKAEQRVQRWRTKIKFLVNWRYECANERWWCFELTLAEQMIQSGMGLMTCCSGADISKADRKRPRENNTHHPWEKKTLNVAGGDFGEGGVGTDMAEKTREISRKLGKRDSIKTKTTGKMTMQREKRGESNLSNVRNTPFL